MEKGRLRGIKRNIEIREHRERIGKVGKGKLSR